MAFPFLSAHNSMVVLIPFQLSAAAIPETVFSCSTRNLGLGKIQLLLMDHKGDIGGYEYTSVVDGFEVI